MRISRRFIPWLLVLTIPLGGSDCSISAHSGSSSGGEEEDRADLIVIIGDGQ